jgi:hypothetical protein
MPSNRDALLAEYAEVGNNFRMLTEIRFKLLAFLPVVAGAAAAVLARGNATTLTLAFSLFGLVVTIGLVTYNKRNDQLYDALVARAAAIERNLGIPDGAFANRPRAWFRLGHRRWKADHRIGVSAIYKASIALWLFGALHAAIEMAQHAHSRWISPTWASPIALVAAVGLPILGGWLVKRDECGRMKYLEETAAKAVKLAEEFDIAVLAADPGFRSLCEELADKDHDTVQARVGFLSKHSQEIALYVAKGSPEWTAARTVAVITDLAPEWLYDCATSRRLSIKVGVYPR